jgi:hypothetical protein
MFIIAGIGTDAKERDKILSPTTCEENRPMNLSLSPFRCDVTPPLGHPLCGGWITPATEIVDRQWANGVILFGAGEPIVLLAIDWCEIRNEGHDQWRAALAQAVGTTPERVAVHCVHPHDAVFADPEAERLLRQHGAAGTSLDLEFFEQTMRAVAETAQRACAQRETITQIGTGQARVHQVASNRRVKGPDGKVGPMRGSSCRDEALRAAPEGVIDPFLKTISFWDGERLVAALHYYATHPMSHYGKGGVSCDFCGLARDRLAAEVGGAHLYFTGAAGNIGAGKYNDGSPQIRPIVTERMLTAMRHSLASTTRRPVEAVGWRSLPVRLPTRAKYTEEGYRALLEDASASHLDRYRGATGLAWLNRVRHGHAIDFPCLALNDARVLHLPGEPFVEHQLYAQQLRPDLFIAVAGHGDDGPGYLPTAVAYEEGGYETTWVALVAPEAEAVIRDAISRLLL